MAVKRVRCCDFSICCLSRMFDTLADNNNGAVPRCCVFYLQNVSSDSEPLMDKDE